MPLIWRVTQKSSFRTFEFGDVFSRFVISDRRASPWWMMDNPIAASFSPLIGLPCWGGKKGQGSMFTLEFGEPHLLVREPIVSASDSAAIRARMARRNVNLIGTWTLSIESCCWQVLSHEEAMANEGSGDEKIISAVRELDGQKLVGVALDTLQHKTNFYFDLGGTLTSSPYENETQWLLYMPEHRVLIYRADGCFSLGGQTLKPEEELWQSLPQAPLLIQIGSVGTPLP